METTQPHSPEDLPPASVPRRGAGDGLPPEVDGYRVLGKLSGAGAQGTIWKAIQLSANREVALKFLRAGAFSSDAAKIRFEREVELTATLRHPHIATLYDSGLHHGAYYYAMELIEGVELDEHVRRRHLTQRQVLELMRTVCRALQHAHQRGIIHRDLKPSNIMAAEKDGQPRILDFGLATTLQREPHALGASRPGEVAGTYPYMSPEQAKGKVDEVDWIDTRTDVYALGVILYRLLTDKDPRGITPQLLRERPDEVIRRVREDQVIRPRAASRQIDRELEALLLKALAYDRSRRYGSAGELAADIDNYLNDNPVTAHRPGALYSLRKWLRRHRVGVSIAAAVVAGLAGFAVYAYGRIADERDIARAAEAEAADERDVAEFARFQTKLERDAARAAEIEADDERDAARAAEAKADDERDAAVAAEAKAADERDIAEFATFEAELDRDAARAAEIEADEQRHRAEAARLRIRRRLMLTSVETGWRLFEQRDLSGALLYCVEALRLAAGGAGEAPVDANGLVNHRVRVGQVLMRVRRPQAILPHDGPVEDAAMSPDGRRIATAGRDGWLRLWDAGTGSPVGVGLRFGGPVLRVCFGPAGKRIAAAGADGSVCVCDGRLAELHRAQHRGAAVDVCFAPDGRRVASAGRDGVARLLELGSGNQRDLNHGAPLVGAAFNHAGDRLVTWGQDGAARLWDPAGAREAAPRLQHGGCIRQAAFSPDDCTVLTAGDDGAARLWDARTGRRLPKKLGRTMGPNRGLLFATFSPDGRWIVTAGEDHTARRIRRADGAGESDVRDLAHAGAVVHAAFGPGAERLVTAGRDHTARIWQTETGERLGCLRHGGPVVRVVFSPDGNSVLSASRDGTARVYPVRLPQPAVRTLPHTGRLTPAGIWRDGRCVTIDANGLIATIHDANSGAPGRVLRHPKWVSHASLSADGRRVVTAGHDGVLRVWDARAGTLVRELPSGAEQAAGLAASSRDGGRVAAAIGRAVHVWDVRTRKKLGTLEHDGEVMHAAFSPDGRRLATAGGGKCARVWDMETRRRVGEALGHGSAVGHVAFSPDGRRVVTASHDGTARVWNAETGRPLAAPLKHHDVVYRAVFGPAGERVATAGRDGTARVWGAATGRALTAPLVHGAAVRYVSFSPDGRRVVTGSDDGTARVWDAATGQPVTPALAHGDAVFYAAFAPGGRRVVTAGDDGAVRIWDAAPDRRGVEELVLLAELLAARRIDASGTVGPLPPDALRTNWRALQHGAPAGPPGGRR